MPGPPGSGVLGAQGARSGQLFCTAESWRAAAMGGSGWVAGNQRFELLCGTVEDFVDSF